MNWVSSISHLQINQNKGTSGLEIFKIEHYKDLKDVESCYYMCGCSKIMALSEKQVYETLFGGN
jgi:hypothetical protein